MKCPSCNTDLAPTRRSGVDLDLCPSCKGMWLSCQELVQLEDEVFDLGDDKKGSLMLGSEATQSDCPQCGKRMKRFGYRLYDVEMDFCEDGHGYWLDADEDKKVLDIMKREEADLTRKVLAEDRWATQMKQMRSGSFLAKVRNLFR